MTTVILEPVVPVTVTVEAGESCSSTGAVTVRIGPDSVWGDEGVGVEVPTAETGEGVIISPVSLGGDCLRLLLAVQIPKVMRSPRTKPIVTAAKTSFFMGFLFR